MNERLMTPKDQLSSKALGIFFGCVFGAALLFVLWEAAFGCFLADTFGIVTSRCALHHLEASATCRDGKDILGVDDVTSANYVDSSGKRHEEVEVIYRFRRRPNSASGPLSDEVLRDEVEMSNVKGKWVAGCELP
jgi:hypothetical protein